MFRSQEEKIRHYKGQIFSRKQDIAQIQGKMDMIKEQLADMGINSKKELEDALKKADKEYRAAREEYESKMAAFEDKYGEQFVAREL